MIPNISFSGCFPSKGSKSPEPPSYSQATKKDKPPKERTIWTQCQKTGEITRGDTVSPGIAENWLNRHNQFGPKRDYGLILNPRATAVELKKAFKKQELDQMA